MNLRIIDVRLELLIEAAYTRLKPNHLFAEDYCTTLSVKMHCARLCLDSLLSTSAANDQQFGRAVLKECESCIFFLSSAIEVLSHIINIFCGLNISEKDVSFDAVCRHAALQNTALAGILVAKRSEPWFADFTLLRNRITHRRMMEIIFRKQADTTSYAELAFQEGDSLRAKYSGRRAEEFLLILIEHIERIVVAVVEELVGP